MYRIALVYLLSLMPTLGFAAKWYKGNTHVHTVLCGHADSTPEVVAQWYHDRGYNHLPLNYRAKSGMIFSSSRERKLPEVRTTEVYTSPR
jgi:hypothetical protein